MFEYLECLMEGLKAMGGDRIRVPERRRFDPEESCMSDFLLSLSLSRPFWN